MPAFTYKALDDKSGRESTGVLTAEDRKSAVALVKEKGLRPVFVREQGENAGSLPHERSISVQTAKISKASVDSFTRELGNLLAAGVPLGRALHILTREASNPAAKKLWISIRDDVVNGSPLADAMARWPRSFSKIYVAMVRAGEMGGFLEVVLGQIADMRMREHDLKNRVKAALIYPSVLGALVVFVLIFMVTFFIPRFASLFAEHGEALPSITRAIVYLSNFVGKYGLLLLAALIAGLIVGKRALSTESGKRKFEMFLLRIPVVGVVIARFSLVRFCRMLGALLQAGVPLVNALRVSRAAIGNRILSDTLDRAIEEVRRGVSLARSLAGCPELLPPSVVEMVAVAEESGRMEKELLRLADNYEQDLDRRLRMAVALAEPILLFIMAAIVGTIVIAMMLPIFTFHEIIG